MPPPCLSYICPQRSASHFFKRIPPAKATSGSEKTEQETSRPLPKEAADKVPDVKTVEPGSGVIRRSKESEDSPEVDRAISAQKAATNSPRKVSCSQSNKHGSCQAQLTRYAPGRLVERGFLWKTKRVTKRKPLTRTMSWKMIPTKSSQSKISNQRRKPTKKMIRLRTGAKTKTEVAH
mmetsp:Transcript_34550/g.136112  ORF Transcript_34550/g.136112 Transcript_34550/m.136112 type:complete len:178 (-) Transcript_34550:2136-2669(-)